MNIFITGINGFIANHLAHFFSKQGHIIYGSTSKLHITKTLNKDIERIYRLQFLKPMNIEMFQKMDVIIHCAHDFERGALKKNVQGTVAIAEESRRQGIKKQVFLSSLSARPDAVTEYGKTKYEIERYFLRHQGIIVRPGTVMGTKGVFGRIVGLMKRFPILPLLDGGQSQMYLIGITDLCKAISLILNHKGPLELNLYYPEKYTLQTVLTHLKTLLQRNVLLIPLPSAFFLLPLSGLQRMGVRLPIDVDNLRGFAKSQEMSHRSDLKTIMEPVLSFEKTLKKALCKEK